MTVEESQQPESRPPGADHGTAFSRGRRLARDVLERIRYNPAQNIPILVAVIAAVIGLGTGLRILSTMSVEDTRQRRATLDDALAALDAGDFETARNIAADLRSWQNLPAEEAGGSAYVLGIVMARNAETQWARRERRLRFLLAAGYLAEAKAAGFPPGREGYGLYMLGKSYHDAGQYARSLSPLHEALDVDRQRRTKIHGLLMNAYLRDAEPQLDKALEHTRAYLADDALASEQRSAALLTQAEIFFKLDQVPNCSATLSSIPETSPQHARAVLLRGRVLLRKGDKLAEAAENETTTAEAFAKYEAARERFGEARAEGPPHERLDAQTQYLTGVTYRKTASLRPKGQEKLVDLRAALDHFSRTHRAHFGSAEAVSASLAEAEIQQQLQDDDAAIESFHRTLRLASDLQPYNNPWTPLAELQSRYEAAYNAYIDAGEYGDASRLATGMSTLFPESLAVLRQAEAREEAAKQLAGEAESLVPSAAEPFLAESRAEHRQAAALFARLAKLRFASRNYPDDLWRSAENYRNGQDYERAVRYYKKFLDTQSRAARPPALTNLGKAMLAINKPQEALPWLTEVIEQFPRDPHSYRARVIAAMAQRELGNTEQAKALLNGNLQHELLTPRSIEWRDSLFALGELHYREGLRYETQSRLDGVNGEESGKRKQALKQLELAQESFHQAIRKLSEAVQRDPDARQAIQARYQIAESHRHAAKLPRKKLPTVTIDTTRKQLTAEIAEELTQAETGYRKLRRQLNAKEEQSELSEVEKRILRNCYFGRADALYDMQRYDEAIQAYSNATSRYQHRPEALEAYVQIANCHRRLNRMAEARGTLEQAKVILNRIRPEADFQKTTRYNHEEWSKILDWLGTL